MRAPAREPTVEGENQRCEGRGRKFGRRERKAQIGLLEGGDWGPQDGGHISRDSRLGVHGDEARFVEIDRKPCGQCEVIEDKLKAGRRLDGGLAQNKGIIGVLQNGTRGIRGEWVGQGPSLPRGTDEALQHIRHNDEEVGGERISLAKTIPATDPIAGHTI